MLFPHSCVYCRKYYPSNDRNNAMRGGGECWKWNKVKGGDRRENDCESFEQVGEMVLARKSMYVLKAVDEGDAFTVSFGDAFHHVDFVACRVATLKEGVDVVRARVEGLKSFLSSCGGIAVQKAKQESCSRGKNETIGNPRSELRRRFDILLRGFPRNVQLCYKFVSKGAGCPMIRARVYNRDGVGEVWLLDDSVDDFRTVGDYCSACDGNVGKASLVLAEFRDGAAFLESFLKEFPK